MVWHCRRTKEATHVVHPCLSDRERENIIYGNECLRCGWRSPSRKRPRMWMDTEVVRLKGWEVISMFSLSYSNKLDAQGLPN